MSQVKRIVVLASGEGTNFAALADAIRSGKVSQAEIVALIVNKPDAGALQKAKERNIPAIIIESSSWLKQKKRGEYEKLLLTEVKKHSPDFICLAGYMLVLGQEFIEHFPNKILNIHPSLLPQFRGLHAIRQALEAGAAQTGCSVHLVTQALDAGAVLSQRTISITAGETEESVRARLQPLEHEAYVEALQRVTTSEFEVVGDQIRWK